MPLMRWIARPITPMPPQSTATMGRTVMKAAESSRLQRIALRAAGLVAGVATACALALGASAPARAAATIVIVNLNAPGEGFNDPTPAAPVGGNTGTTLGQQRLN